MSMNNGTVYTLTNFQRPEPAIAFLINFWNLIRKEKFLSKSGGSNSAWSENSSSTERCCPMPESASPSTRPSMLPKAPTTISLTSSASMSESDSGCSGRAGSVRIQPTTSPSTPSFTMANETGSREKRPVAASPTVPARVTNLYQSSPKSRDPSVEPCYRQSSQLTSSSPSTNPTLHSPSTIAPSHHKDSVTSPHVQRSTRTAVVRAEAIATLRPSKSAPQHLHSAQQQPPQQAGGASATSNTAAAAAATGLPRGPKTRVCLADNSGWSIWPLSFLPFPLSSPPQRLTMIIAYAILTFLLFSITHLYHRLAVFDLTLGPQSRLAPDTVTAASPEQLNVALHSLESHLTQLVDLAGQMAQSLVQLTTELRSVQQNWVDQTPTTSSVAPSLAAVT